MCVALTGGPPRALGGGHPGAGFGGYGGAGRPPRLPGPAVTMAGGDGVRALTLALGLGTPFRSTEQGYNGGMITNYIAAALRRARYETVDDGLICATVPGLRGVIATASTVESCRTQLAEVIEAWILVRVARGLNVPAIGRTTVQIKQAS